MNFSGNFMLKKNPLDKSIAGKLDIIMVIGYVVHIHLQCKHNAKWANPKRYWFKSKIITSMLLMLSTLNPFYAVFEVKIRKTFILFISAANATWILLVVLSKNVYRANIYSFMPFSDFKNSIFILKKCAFHRLWTTYSMPMIEHLIKFYNAHALNFLNWKSINRKMNRIDAANIFML